MHAWCSKAIYHAFIEDTSITNERFYKKKMYDRSEMSNQLTNGIHVKRFHFASNVFTTTLLNRLPCNERFSVSSWKSKTRFRFQSGILLSCQSRWDGINKRLLSDHDREFLKWPKRGILHKDRGREFLIEATVENFSVITKANSSQQCNSHNMRRYLYLCVLTVRHRKHFGPQSFKAIVNSPKFCCNHPRSDLGTTPACQLDW